MRENIKRQLDQSIPEQIILTNDRKNKILNEASHRLENKKLSRPRMFKPLLVGVAIAGLSLFLSFPYVQQWSEDRAFHQANKDSLVDVTIPDVDYPSLIRAKYVGATNELVYTDNNGIYAYSIDSETKRALVEPKKGAGLFEFAVNENWLTWEENKNSSSKMYVLDRTTNEIKEYSDENVGDYHLDGNILTFLSFGKEDLNPTYQRFDLPSFEETKIYELVGDGANSSASISEGTMVIPERLKTEHGNRTVLYLYDLHGKASRGKYAVPFENAELVTFTDGKIYSQLTNEGDSESVLAYIDLKDGRLYELEAPPFNEYAVYKNYVALSVKWKDSNTVKLYKISGNSLVELPTFNHIKERLVRPRFTDEGILIVNGESDQFTMYLQDVNQLK